MKARYSENFVRELLKEPDVNRFWAAVRVLKSDPEKALAMLKSLSQKGSTLSMVYIGDAYVNGRGVPRDTRVGDQWYMRAADGGSIEASYRLAIAWWHLREYERSVERFISLSQLGFAPAMCCLGSIYNAGFGLKRDADLAQKYWKMASDKGHFIAKQGLSHLLRSGELGIFSKIKGYYILLYLLVVGSYYKFTFPESDRFRCW